MKKFSENKKIYESTLNTEVLSRLKSSDEYEGLVENTTQAIETFCEKVDKDNIDYGNTDNYRALETLVSEAASDAFQRANLPNPNEDIGTYTDFEELPTNENVNTIRATVKAALKNMYMFGGMPRPDPKYDQYLNNMIEMIMTSIGEKLDFDSELDNKWPDEREIDNMQNSASWDGKQGVYPHELKEYLKTGTVTRSGGH